jgi:hypothetical protein
VQDDRLIKKEKPVANSLTGLFLFVVFSIMAWFTFTDLYAQLLLIKGGVSMPAEVVNVATRHSKKSTTRYVSYKLGSRVYEKPVEPALFVRALKIWRARKKGTINIIALPDNLNVNAVYAGPKEAFKGLVYSILVLGMLIFSVKLMAASFAAIFSTIFFVCLAAGLGHYAYYNYFNNIYSAVYRQDIKMLQKYISSNRDINKPGKPNGIYRFYSDSSGMTPLEAAVKNKWVQGIMALIDNNAQITDRKILARMSLFLPPENLADILEKANMESLKNEPDWEEFKKDLILKNHKETENEAF